MSYWGDFPLEETLNFLFTTRAFATGIPTVLAGTPVLSVYEDTNLTQITAGVTITVDHDAVVGLNRANVVATAANGYEAGKTYTVVITTGTVGGVSVVGEVVGTFTIDRGAALRPTVASRTLDIAATGEAGVDFGNILGTLDAANIGTDAITAAKIAANAIGASELATDAIGDAQIATGAIASTAFAAGAINAAAIATDAITAAKIAADAIGASELATDAIGSAQLATTAVNEIRDAILSDATTFAGANIDATISSRATPAQVNTEVSDVLKTDTVTLPGQLAPPLTPTFEEMISWLYKTFRNRKTQTATQWSLLADDESTVDAKATTSDDGTTAIKQEIVTGP